MKTTITLLFILVLNFAAFSQTEQNKPDKKAKPNFTGTWVLDRAKTKNVDYDLTLVVLHSEPEIKINGDFDSETGRRTEQRIYYTDNRRLPGRKVFAESVSEETGWAGRTLILKTRLGTRIEGSYRNIEAVATEEWKISKDGKQLTVTVTEGYATPSGQPAQGADGAGLGQASMQGGRVKVLKFNRQE